MMSDGEQQLDNRSEAGTYLKLHGSKQPFTLAYYIPRRSDPVAKGCRASEQRTFIPIRSWGLDPLLSSSSLRCTHPMLLQLDVARLPAKVQ